MGRFLVVGWKFRARNAGGLASDGTWTFNPGMTGVGRTLIDCLGVGALRWEDEAKPESNSLVLEKTAALWSPSADKVGAADYLPLVESSWKRERL